MERDEKELLEAATTAFRPTEPDGGVRMHPAWLDLSPAAREVLFEETLKLRALEAAAHPTGLSTTAQRVLARVRGG